MSTRTQETSPTPPPSKRSMIWVGLILVVLTIGLMGLVQLQNRHPAGPPPLKGMALGTFHANDQYSYESDLAEIQSLGANAILLMVPWYQRDIRSNRMEARHQENNGDRTLSDAKLVDIITLAHQKNLQVMLMPYLRFDQRAPKEWRGVIDPKNFQEWSQHYYQFILHYAGIAQAHGVEIFSIGSELGATEKNLDFWLPLIQAVRKKYSGKITYSANWDHYETPKFWPYLDYIGITAYNRLSETVPPDPKTLRNKLVEIKSKILKFMKGFPEKKLIFTEVGFPSLQGASKDPWNYFMKTPVDLEEQALCYQGFIETWDHTPELAGVFWWVWYGRGGPEDKSYTPKGKPAEAILRKWYGGEAKNP